jgi:hypothetical protein
MVCQRRAIRHPYSKGGYWSVGSELPSMVTANLRTITLSRQEVMIGSNAKYLLE